MAIGADFEDEVIQVLVYRTIALASAFALPHFLVAHHSRTGPARWSLPVQRERPTTIARPVRLHQLEGEINQGTVQV